LPIQSGSDDLLKKMNRQHTAEDYLKVIEAVRDVRPDIALSSDFIIGHPGECDRDFEKTLQLIETVGFAQAYSFKYSPRPGTPASTISEQIPEDIKSVRLEILQNLLNKQQKEFNVRFLGESVPVLFDRKGKLPSQIAGRSPHMQAVHVNCKEAKEVDKYFGSTVNVRITEAFSKSLTGIIEHTTF